MQIWAETVKSALPIHNYSQILYQFLTFTQNLKWSRNIPTFITLFKAGKVISYRICVNGCRYIYLKYITNINGNSD